MKLWDAATGRPLRFELSGPTDKVAAAALSPDGTRLAATRRDHTVLVWDLATGDPITLEGPADAIAYGVRFSPDGKRLVSPYRPATSSIHDAPRSIRIWDLASRKPVVTLDRFPDGMRHASFSPDGRHWPPASRGRRSSVYDAETGRRGILLQGSRRDHGWAVFSPDGKRLAAWGQGDPHLGCGHREPVATWPSDSSTVYRLAYSPDGRRLARGGIEGIVEIWDTATGQKVQTFKGHAGASTPWPSARTARAWPPGAPTAPCDFGTRPGRWDAAAIPKAGRQPLEIPDLSPDGQTLLTVRSGERKSSSCGTRRQVRCAAARSSSPAVHQHPGLDRRRRTPVPGGRGQDRQRRGVASGKVVRRFQVDAEPNVLHHRAQPRREMVRLLRAGWHDPGAGCPDRRPIPHDQGARRRTRGS